MAYKHTEAAQAFLASADSRETSIEIMRAIVAFARNANDAEIIWEDGIENWFPGSAKAFVNMVTSDGAFDPTEFHWGAAGGNWVKGLDV